MVMGVILWLLNHISVQRDVIHEFISIGAEMDLSMLHILQILRSTLFNGCDESPPTWVRGKRWHFVEFRTLVFVAASTWTNLEFHIFFQTGHGQKRMEQPKAEVADRCPD